MLVALTIIDELEDEVQKSVTDIQLLAEDKRHLNATKNVTTDPN